MLQNYVKTALRNLMRSRTFSMINLLNLTVGIACVFLIMLWVQSEYSWDAHQENLDELYLVKAHLTYNGVDYPLNVSPGPVGPAIEEDIPQVKAVTRYKNHNTMQLKVGDVHLSERYVYSVEPSYFDLFTYTSIAGNPRDAIESRQAVISRSTAAKLFGESDPLGKTVTFNDETDCIVGAVVEDSPEQSQLSGRVFVNIDYFTRDDRDENWGRYNFFTYIQIDPAVKEEILPTLKEFFAVRNVEEGAWLGLEAMKDAHLYVPEAQGNLKSVRVFTIVGLLILVIACFNFMNLMFARAQSRMLEVGMRKVIGARSSHLFWQFMTETLLLCVFALVLAVILIEVSLPLFNQLTAQTFHFNVLENGFQLGLLVALLMLTGILAGGYPSLILARKNPIYTIKGAKMAGRQRVAFRVIVVVLQFLISASLITASIVVHYQFKYVQNKELGYNKENVMMISFDSARQKHFGVLREKLINSGGVVNVGLSSDRITYNSSVTGGARWNGKDPEEMNRISFISADEHFLQTMGIQLKEGRNFHNTPASLRHEFIVNEELQAKMGGDAVGKGFWAMGYDGTVVGVIKNYHYQPLQNKINMMYFTNDPDSYNYLYIRMQPQNLPQTIQRIEGIWEELYGDGSFTYSFVDEVFDRYYRKEMRAGKLISFFCALAVFISSLGLLALSSYLSQLRLKEIGIRKVLGATVSQLGYKLTSGYLLWIAVANLLSIPLCIYFMNKWLQGFAYHTSITVPMFLTTLGLTLLVGGLTVGIQAVRAARSNPVKVLKYE